MEEQVGESNMKEGGENKKARLGEVGVAAYEVSKRAISSDGRQVKKNTRTKEHQGESST